MWYKSRFIVFVTYQVYTSQSILISHTSKKKYSVETSITQETSDATELKTHNMRQEQTQSSKITSRITTVIKKQKQKKLLISRLQPRKINHIKQIWRFDWEGLEYKRARISELTLEIQKLTNKLELECNAKG